MENQGFSFFDCIRWDELHRGTIRFASSIDHDSVLDFLSELAFVQHKLDKNLITIMLHSDGGYTYSAFAMYDAIIDARKRGFAVDIVVEGLAASAASMIVLQAATKRKAYPNARFLIHEIRRWISEPAVERQSDGQDGLEEMKAISEIIYGILADRCNKQKREVRLLVERKEVWMSAKEALNFGLIDEIV